MPYRMLLQQLNKAREAGKLSCGIKAVWNTATHKKGRLLVLEDPYTMKEVIDDIIEKVLKNGGDVEFVAQGTLSEFQEIVLIEATR